MEQFDQLDHYAVLGVSRSATAEEIKRAYRQQMARYHPDRFAGASPEDQVEAGRRAQRINEAYQVLSDFRARAAYNRTLTPEARVTPSRSTPVAPAPPRDHLAELYEQARAHLDAGRALQAAATLRELQAINPFYRDSAALLEQAEAAARTGQSRRAGAPRTSQSDRGRRALLIGGLGGLLLAGAAAVAWVTRRPDATAAPPIAGGELSGRSATTPATAVPAPTAAPPTVQSTAQPASQPTVAPPTVEPSALSTAEPTAAPTTAPTVPPSSPTPAPLPEEGNLVYAESFAGRRGWPSLAGNGWSIGFAEDAYQIVAEEGTGNIWAFGTSPVGTDFLVGVEVEVSGGLAGLMLRYSDATYLAYLVDPEAGVYRLEQWRSGRSDVIAAEAHPSVALGPGARNRLVARLQGEQVSLRVNGVPVADLAVASPAPTPRYGMLAFATASEVVARFRNLAIREL